MSSSYEHIKQMKKAFNKQELSNAKTVAEYEYILNRQELENSYLEKMEDLKYPLRVEPKRDRYVLNKRVMKIAMEKACEEALNLMQKDITLWLCNTVPEIVQELATDALNSITVVNNQFVAKPIKTKSKTSWAEKLGAQFGKALAQSIMNIFDDMVNGRRKYD